jgi:hypothetical protein
VLQRHLSEQQALGQIEKYNSYKAAIEEYFHNERRWGKKAGGIRHVAPAPCEEADCQHAHAHGASEADPQDAADGWAADLMVQINALNALVRNNFSKKGKGKGNFSGPTNPGKGNAMDVDSSGGDTKPNHQQKRKCYECGEEGHIGRECPVRQARVANGGPPILSKGGKEGKGGKYGKDGKGGGKNGKAGKGWWPNQTEWRQMRPGPSPSLWGSWYPHAGQAAMGGANVFDIPQALSPLSPCAPPGSPPSLSPIQQLFQSGAGFGVYSLTEKRKATKAEVEIPKKCSTVPSSDKSFAHPNAFSALQSEDEDEGPSPALTVNLVDAIKPPSANQARKARERATRSRRGEATTATKSTSTKSTSSFPTLSKSALYAVEQIKNPQNVEDITTATLQSSRLTRSAATAQASVRVPFWPDQPGPRRTVAPSYGLVSPEPQSTICATPEHMEPAYEYAKDKNDLPNPSRPRTSEAEVQTAVSLRSTQLDVIWTASILETVVDSPEMEDATEDEEVIDDETSTVCADVGERADMLDSIEQESQELDCMNVLMNIYIHMMAVIMIVMFASAHEDHRVKDGSDEEDGDINVVVENDDVKMWRTPKASKGPQRRRMKLRKGITVDSGAHSNVMPKRMIRDQSKIRPSPGSKRGAHFVAANNGRIANEGEIDFVFKTAEGHERSFVFQVAETNKPLGAASYFVDDGFRVVFDKDMKTGVDLSMMLNKATGEITRFRRVRNIWVMDATIEEEILPHECPFHRQA